MTTDGYRHIHAYEYALEKFAGATLYNKSKKCPIY